MIEIELIEEPFADALLRYEAEMFLDMLKAECRKIGIDVLDDMEWPTESIEYCNHKLVIAAYSKHLDVNKADLRESAIKNAMAIKEMKARAVAFYAFRQIYAVKPEAVFEPIRDIGKDDIAIGSIIRFGIITEDQMIKAEENHQ